MIVEVGLVTRKHCQRAGRCVKHGTVRSSDGLLAWVPQARGGGLERGAKWRSTCLGATSTWSFHCFCWSYMSRFSMFWPVVEPDPGFSSTCLGPRRNVNCKRQLRPPQITIKLLEKNMGEDRALGQCG